MLHNNAQYVALRVVWVVKATKETDIWNKRLFRLRENQSYGPQEQFLRIRMFFQFFSPSVCFGFCVCDRESVGGPPTLPMGKQDSDECQWVNFDTSFTSSMRTHTDWCVVRCGKGRRIRVKRGDREGPSTKLTGQLTMIDKHKQCDHVQTPHPPERQCQGFTHTHTALTPALQTAHPLKDTHIH